MHPIARRCLWGAVVLWVAGAALIGLAPTLYDLADGWLGEAVNIVVGFLQEALVPTGAVLVGAAVVIQALRGTRPSSVAELPAGSQVSPASGAVPAAEPHPLTPTPPAAAPSSGVVPSVPASSPVPAGFPVPGPPSSGSVATAAPVPTAGPVLPGTGDAPVAPEQPARGGRQPRTRRKRA